MELGVQETDTRVLWYRKERSNEDAEDFSCDNGLSV